jgi:hypothetical protein
MGQMATSYVNWATGFNFRDPTLVLFDAVIGVGKGLGQMTQGMAKDDMEMFERGVEETMENALRFVPGVPVATGKKIRKKVKEEDSKGSR